MNPVYNVVINTVYCIPFKDQALLLNTDKGKNIQEYKDVNSFLTFRLPFQQR
jgi:hypothetical protein